MPLFEPWFSHEPNIIMECSPPDTPLPFASHPSPPVYALMKDDLEQA